MFPKFYEFLGKTCPLCPFFLEKWGKSPIVYGVKYPYQLLHQLFVNLSLRYLSQNCLSEK